MATNILMPALSPTMEEGKLAKWLVKEGDTVKSGDILAEIETDKATMEFEAVDEGRIGKILVPEGSEGVKVNAPIAVLLDEGEKRRRCRHLRRDEEHRRSGEGRSAEESRSARSRSAPRPKRPRRKPRRLRRARRASRTATASSPRRWRAASPPEGHRSRRAVAAPARAAASSNPMSRTPSRRAKPAAAAAAAAQPPARGIPASRRCRMRGCSIKAGDYEEIPHDSMRKAIAKRLTSAKTLIPHYYLTIDCNLDALMATRATLNEAAPKARQGRPTSCRSTTSS